MARGNNEAACSSGHNSSPNRRRSHIDTDNKRVVGSCGAAIQVRAHNIIGAAHLTMRCGVLKSNGPEGRKE